MNPISRGEGPEVLAPEMRLCLLVAREEYGHSDLFSSNRMLAGEAEDIMLFLTFWKIEILKSRFLGSHLWTLRPLGTGRLLRQR
mgnify:CR=1 FL=1